MARTEACALVELHLFETNQACTVIGKINLLVQALSGLGLVAIGAAFIMICENLLPDAVSSLCHGGRV
jgi:hypothetical protein